MDQFLVCASHDWIRAQKSGKAVGLRLRLKLRLRLRLLKGIVLYPDSIYKEDEGEKWKKNYTPGCCI